MSIFAGIFSRSPIDKRIPQSAKESLRGALSRRAGGQRDEFDSAQLYLLKLDFGAFRAAGFSVEQSGSVSAIAGEPLLDSSLGVRRDVELSRIGSDIVAGRHERLREATGAFCLVHFDPTSATLVLLTDRLGVRPIYYAVTDEYVFFATALRILESMPEVRKTLDLRAVTELDGLGVPLGDRTPYAEIRVLRAAEIMSASASGISRSQYWRWDSIPESSASEQELQAEAFSRFSNAVARRLGSDTGAFAYLSGGLDSRVIVAALRAALDTVHTFNFSPSGTQDQALGAAFAEAIGAHHHEYAEQPGVPFRLARRMAETLEADMSLTGDLVSGSRMIWSGDGGSVGFGHVLVTEAVVDLMREGRTDLAVAAHLQFTRANAPGRVIERSLAKQLTSVVKDGMIAELEDIYTPDRGRAFHLFLLLNDQRRHIHSHFESIDEHQLEMQVPFYDSAFLECILSIPLNSCLYHRFYTRWLQLFSPAVTSVAWQAYPGHTPCPVPVPADLGYQWRLDRGRTDILRARQLMSVRKAMRVITARPFPSQILDRSFLIWAMALTRLGVRDYRYVADTAERYHRYWDNADGRYTVD